MIIFALPVTPTYIHVSFEVMKHFLLNWKKTRLSTANSITNVPPRKEYRRDVQICPSVYHLTRSFKNETEQTSINNKEVQCKQGSGQIQKGTVCLSGNKLGSDVFEIASSSQGFDMT